MNIQEIKPGRELDALVGKSLGINPNSEWWAMDKKETGSYMRFDREFDALKWHEMFTEKYKKHPYSTDGGHIVKVEIYPKYSADISEAWEIAEKFGLDGWEYSLNRYNRLSNQFEFCLLNVGKRIPVWSNNIPEAICKAALLAMENENGQ